VVTEVARQLGNTPAVCRKCYLHPAVVEAYQAGALEAGKPPSPVLAATRLSLAERRLLALLRREAAQGSREPLVAAPALQPPARRV
jgi:DNA topoisomerase-1